MNPKILRLPDVQSSTGLSRSTIYAAIQRREFPQQIALGRRAVGWRADDIAKWIESREVRA